MGNSQFLILTAKKRQKTIPLSFSIKSLKGAMILTVYGPILDSK
jgi:hypothetical protein